MSELIATDAKEQLARWDLGDTIWSIEMGGIGPGYEQALQILAVEIVRDNIGKEVPAVGTPMDAWADSTVSRIDKPANHLGFSGAQVGAAKFLAYKWLTVGPAALCDDPGYKDRHIQVSNIWPRVNPGT